MENQMHENTEIKEEPVALKEKKKEVQGKQELGEAEPEFLKLLRQSSELPQCIAKYFPPNVCKLQQLFWIPKCFCLVESFTGNTSLSASIEFKEQLDDALIHVV